MSQSTVPTRARTGRTLEFPDGGSTSSPAPSATRAPPSPASSERPGRQSEPSPGIPSGPPGDTASTSAPSTSTTRRPASTRCAGRRTLYNTYWVRFPHGPVDHDARRRQLPHPLLRGPPRRRASASCTCRSPTRASPPPTRYFRGKAEVERVLAEVGRPLRRPPPRHPLRWGRRAPQQHRLAAAAPAGLRRGRPGRLPHPPHPRRRPGSPERGGRRASAPTRSSTPWAPNARPSSSWSRLIRDTVGSRARIVRVPGAVMPALSSAARASCCGTCCSRGEEYRAMAAGLADTDGPATGHRRGDARGSGRPRRHARAPLRQRDRAPLPACRGVDPCRALRRRQLQVTRTSAVPRAR